MSIGDLIFPLEEFEEIMSVSLPLSVYPKRTTIIILDEWFLCGLLILEMPSQFTPFLIPRAICSEENSYVVFSTVYFTFQLLIIGVPRLILVSKTI